MKKIVLLTVMLSLVICSLASCKEEPEFTSSITSSVPDDVVSVPDDPNQSAWGSSENKNPSLRPSFMDIDDDGNYFYCAVEGGVYKKIAETSGLSKVYSSSGYDFFSVQCTRENEICVGYTGKVLDSSYVFLNLEDKTVRNAVNGEQFENTSVYSLTYYGGRTFFLANPDRYNRYTLYMQVGDKTIEISGGVNEFFILRDRVFFNNSSVIYSATLNGTGIKYVTDLGTCDLLGFTIINDQAIFMTSVESYCMQMGQTTPTRLEYNIKTFDYAQTDDYAFFCGVNGGIYMMNLLTLSLQKVSDYTAGKLYSDGEFLYLTPASASDYVSVDEEHIISEGIFRFSIQELIEYTKGEDGGSSDLGSSDNEVSEPKPESFGR